MSDHDQHEHDDLVEEEYLQQDEVLEEEVPDLDQGEPMESDDDEAVNPLEGYELRPSADDENVMELADDSVQGFFDHQEPVYAVALNPKFSNIVVSGGGDDKSYLWRTDTGEKLFEFDGHKDSVTSVAFSVNGDYVASAGMDGKVRVWKTETGEFCCAVDGPDEINWIDWHPKGNILLAGATDSTIWMWAMPSGKFMNIFNGHAGPVTAGRFTPDGKKIVSVCEDTSLIVWDPKSAAAEIRLSGEDARFHLEPITTVAVNRDSTLAITGSMDGKARLINIIHGNIVASLENHSESVETASFCDVLPLAATGSVDGTISIWDVQTQRLRSTLRHEDAVVKVEYVRNSAMLVSCSVDKTLKLWDTRTGNCVRTWVGHRDTILDFAISNDGQTIVTASDDGHCLVFKA
ncbi:quinon protein alcohol dehydrogenase-like superfamily [Radiomyces spectabilis]|uniref:quinon protein alcohol dehydrogenase-like superfamily n=1 Tax=Radiomyces spectabilis TaxID=64574 RepID=UPI002220CAD3|nr:quinon protein alcohol dehydrogenase-like superfamily [Radiomyces spectabilis]KAI8391766.1 quinon protein alcohol dehydrogenase-like superfamily [Radiomyces spectabilis]